MKLIIAEKPSVAKELKAALEPSAQFFKSEGSGYFKGKNFIFACSLGHIITYLQPRDIDEKYKANTFDILPLPFRPIPMSIGQHPAQTYYNTLRNVLLNEKYDEIIVATDPDREGQGIYERIKTYMTGFPTGIPESRMWIKEWTLEGLRNAYRGRVANANYKGLGDAAECRAYDDYSVGMNGSIACSARFNTFLTVGRVQTAVNKIIVSREEEILRFVPQKYQAVSLMIDTDEPPLTLELKHKTDDKLTQDEADALCKQLRSFTSVQVAVEEKSVTQKPLKLGGQTDFLQVMNKKYGFDAKTTSSLLQALYQDRKLTTYPGTEAHEISVSASKMALRPLENLLGNVNDEIDRLVRKVIDNHWTIAPHCVTSKELPHEAITPVFGTINSTTVKALSEPERKCYIEIIKRYLQAFFPKAVFSETIVTTTLAGENFVAKGKVLQEEGYLEVVGRGEDSVIPRVSDGGTYRVVDIKNEEKETKPPARYTEATLLDAMKNAGRFVDDKHYADILKSEEVEGLGTGRTRSAILEALKKRGYYTLKNKSIYATQTAIDLIRLLPDNIMLTSPVMTAQMEEALKLVEEGKVSKESHMNDTDRRVREMIESIRNVEGDVTAANSNVLCQCPRCGGNVIETNKTFSCAQKCGLVLFKEDKFFSALGKKMTKSYAKHLLTSGQTLVKDIVSKKTGKPYNLIVKVDWSEQGLRYSTEFPVARKKR